MTKYIIGFVTAILAGTLASFAVDYTPASVERSTIIDTNTTVNLSAHLPAFAGLMLLGPNATNVVFVSIGTTTSSWVKVSN